MKRGGQRVATMLMYLTDNVEGGETFFPLVRVAFLPLIACVNKASSVISYKVDTRCVVFLFDHCTYITYISNIRNPKNSLC